MAYHVKQIPTSCILGRLRYDQDSGALTWANDEGRAFSTSLAKRRFMAVHAGRPAGGVERHGYVTLRIDRVQYKAHRIIWEMHNGPIPSGMQVDHVNGVRHDNRIENLRLVTRSQNLMNKAVQSNNRSGYPGVYWNKAVGKWHAQISSSGKKTHIGFFTSLDDAAQARRAFTERDHGEYGLSDLRRNKNNHKP